MQAEINGKGANKTMTCFND